MRRKQKFDYFPLNFLLGVSEKSMHHLYGVNFLPNCIAHLENQTYHHTGNDYKFNFIKCDFFMIAQRNFIFKGQQFNSISFICKRFLEKTNLIVKPFVTTNITTLPEWNNVFSL